MSVSDYIQIATFIVVLVTMIIFSRMLLLQYRMYKAQMLKDRFETYWRTYGSVTSNEIKEAMLFPEDYMSREKFESYYQKNELALHKYIHLYHLYEYLAFNYLLKNIKYSDPLGNHWTRHWLDNLTDQKEFLDVHEYCKLFYPDFSKYVDEFFKKKIHRAKKDYP